MIFFLKAIDQDLAGVREDKSSSHFQESTFSGPIGAAQNVCLGARKTPREISKDLFGAVSFANMLKFEGEGHSCSASPLGWGVWYNNGLIQSKFQNSLPYNYSVMEIIG